MHPPRQINRFTRNYYLLFGGINRVWVTWTILVSALFQTCSFFSLLSLQLKMLVFALLMKSRQPDMLIISPSASSIFSLYYTIVLKVLNGFSLISVFSTSHHWSMDVWWVLWGKNFPKPELIGDVPLLIPRVGSTPPPLPHNLAIISFKFLFTFNNFASTTFRHCISIC